MAKEPASDQKEAAEDARRRAKAKEWDGITTRDDLLEPETQESNPAYRWYTDSNGVRWSIWTTQRWMGAYVPPDGARIYDPGQGKPGPGDVDPVRRATPQGKAEADAASMVQLREKIDQYALDNRRHVQIAVTAHLDSGVWLVIGLGLLLMFESRGGRR